MSLTPAPTNLFSNPGYQVIETVPAGFTVTATPSTVLPEGIQTITLTPSPNDLFGSPGYQVIESIPAGFAYVDTTAVGSIQGNVITLTQLGSSPITYTIRAPSIIGSYAISGAFIDPNFNLGIVSGTTSLRVGAGYDAVLMRMLYYQNP